MEYREVVFFASESADSFIDTLNEHGAEACINEIISAVGHGCIPDKEALEPFGAPADDHHVSVDHPGYVLSWNLKLNYMGLALKV